MSSDYWLSFAVSYPQTLFTRISFLVFSLRVGCWWANRSLIVFVTFGAPKIYARLVSPISTPFFWPLLKSSFPPLDPDFRFYALLPVLSNVLLRLAYPFLYPTLSILRLWRADLAISRQNFTLLGVSFLCFSNYPLLPSNPSKIHGELMIKSHNTFFLPCPGLA